MTILRASLLLLILAAAGVPARAEEPLWTYDGGFHKKIAAADRLVVRPRVFYPHEVDKYDQAFIDEHSKPIFVGQDAAELRSVAEHIEFKSPQKVVHFFFRGYPILEWYRGEEKLATAASKINCLGAKDFGGDVELTTESAEWVADWLVGHGFDWTRKQLDRHLHVEAVAAEAAPVLAAHTPPVLPTARAQSEAEAEEDNESDSLTEWFDRQDAAFDRRLRAAYDDHDAMYQELFRLVGCLPMVWDSPYPGAQLDAFEFLGRAPREELDWALRAALNSNDKDAVRGAVWVLYAGVDAEDEEDFEGEERVHPRTGVTESDLQKWYTLFAETAYADPFPENRRVVWRRLAAFPQTIKLPLVRAALADPDQTVRRIAIEVLWTRGGDAELTLLRAVAAGEIKPRAAAALPRNHAEGINEFWAGSDNDPGEYDSTDQDAAEGGIFRIELERRRRREEAAGASRP